MRCRGPVVVGVQVALAGIEPGDTVLAGGEVPFGAGGAGGRLGDGGAGALDLGLPGGPPRPHRRELTRQGGEAVP